MIRLSVGPSGTIQDLVHFFLYSIQNVVIQEIVSVVDVKGQIHFSCWEGPVEEYLGFTFVYKK